MSDPSQDPLPTLPVVVDAAEDSAPPPQRTGVADPFRRLRIGLVAAIVAVGLLVAWSWIDSRNRYREIRIEFARKFQEADEAAKETAKTLRSTQDAYADLLSRLAVTEDRLAEAQSQQSALEELYRELAPGRDDWTITEVEQVLLLATQQLQLAGNVRGALTALQLADAKLQRLDRPQFLPLRRALGRDMDRLKSLPFVDVAGLSLRIDQAADAIDKLPLAAEARIQDRDPIAIDQGSTGRRWLDRVWNDLQDLVRIENTQRREIPLLLPAQEYYLRENLKLRLLSSRLALLSRDEPTFRADLKQAEEWLRRYFDTRSKSTQGVLVVLKQLQSTELPAEMPDLNASLEAVRVLKAVRERSSR